VLIVVEHRHKDIEVLEQLLETADPFEGDRVAGSAVLWAVTFDRDGKCERLEYAPDKGLAASAANNIEPGFKGDWGGGELGPFAARAIEGGSEQPGNCDAEKRRGDVRPVVDVVIATQRVAVADEPDGIDLQQEVGGAAAFRHLGIKDMSAAEGKVFAVDAAGILMEQIAEIGGRLKGRG
jgi:hypothetical protein